MFFFSAITHAIMTGMKDGTTTTTVIRSDDLGRIKTSPISYTQSTGGITANGAGTAVNMTVAPASQYTMIVDLTAGSTTTVEVDLECSIDGTDYAQMATITSLAAEPALIGAQGVPCFYMRYNVVTVGSGNTLEIHLLGTTK